MIDMKEEQFELDNTPDAENLWKAIGGSFSNISQAISEFVADSISDFRRNWGKAFTPAVRRWTSPWRTAAPGSATWQMP